jgi:hypothetical protein
LVSADGHTAISAIQKDTSATTTLTPINYPIHTSALQVCISSVLQRHGALSFALMMTSRQCVSVLLSTLLFKHSLSGLQW